MKTFSRQVVLEEVESRLAPFIGATLARASAVTQSRKLELGDKVTFAELEALLDRLRRGLAVFVGTDKSTLLMEDVLRAVTKEDPG